MRARRVIDRRADRWLAPGVGLLAALPVIVGTVDALRAGWTPVFDDAIIAARAYDAFTAHGSLVGIYSDASLPQVGPVFNAGPLLPWLLAIPTRLFGDWALPVSAGLISTASIVGIVALARRRGGAPFMFATALAVLLMCRSFPAETFHDILNASIALLPFTLLLFLAWSLACGEHRLLPVTAFVGSFVLQSHASFAIPAVAVLAVGIGGLAIGTRPLLRRDAPARRWVLGGLAVAVACWTAPVIDQIVNRPGNLALIIDTATTGEKGLGLRVGWHVAAKGIGLPPWWVSASEAGAARFFDLFGRPGAVASVSCAFLLGGLVLAAAVGLRRRRRDVTAVAVLALVLAAVVVLGVSATPVRLSLFAAKATQTLQIAGMFVTLALGFAVVELSRAAWPALSRLAFPRVFAWPALGATALIAVLMATSERPDPSEGIYRPVRKIAAKLSTHLPRHATVSVVSAETSSVIRAYSLTTAMAYQLRRRGFHPVIPDAASLTTKFGTYYSKRQHQPRLELVIDDRGTPSQPGARLVGSEPARLVSNPTFPPRPVTVSVLALGTCPPRSTPTSGPGRDEARLRAAGPWLRGFIDRSEFANDRVELCGWILSTDARRLPQEVALYVDGRFVGAARPTLPRPDVVRAFHAAGGPMIGFSLDVPARLVPRVGGDRIHAFAIGGGRAARIPLGCKPGTRDVGC